jgi:hypothetical protein
VSAIFPPGWPLESGGLSVFRWWHKGRTLEGNTIKLQGRVVAKDASAACDLVDAEMRKQHPNIKWMQGREIEGNGFRFGPTVQKLRGATKQLNKGKEGKEVQS